MIEGITKGIDKLFSMDRQTGQIEELGTVTDFEYTPTQEYAAIKVGDHYITSEQGPCGDLPNTEPNSEIRFATAEEVEAFPDPIREMLKKGTEMRTFPHHVKIDPTTTVLDDKTKAEYKKAADRAIALKDMTIKGLEAIEDQLSDIQTALDDISESVSYGSDAYWHKQVVDLTKFYLQDMIAQRHHSGVKLTEQDVITLVSVATNVATKSIEAIKEQINAAQD